MSPSLSDCPQPESGLANPESVSRTSNETEPSVKRHRLHVGGGDLQANQVGFLPSRPRLDRRQNRLRGALPAHVGARGHAFDHGATEADDTQSGRNDVVANPATE